MKAALAVVAVLMKQQQSKQHSRGVAAAASLPGSSPTHLMVPKVAVWQLAVLRMRARPKSLTCRGGWVGTEARSTGLAGQRPPPGGCGGHQVAALPHPLDFPAAVRHSLCAGIA